MVIQKIDMVVLVKQLIKFGWPYYTTKEKCSTATVRKIVRGGTNFPMLHSMNGLIFLIISYYDCYTEADCSSTTSI